MVLLNRQIAEGATQFLIAGKKCYEELSHKITNNNCFALMPAIVNTSFSIELYLKSMLDENIIEDAKKRRKAHCLDYLLGLLPSGEQSAIIHLSIAQYASICGSSISEEEFWDEMRKVSNSFSEWRYYYEYGGSINIAFLNSVAHALNALYTTILKHSMSGENNNIL